jgi:hypothetical protein
MSLEKQAGLPTAQSNVELESLAERLVERTIARVGHSALKPFINSKECAELLGVTPQHLCAMRARGEGPPWSGSGKWVRYQRAAALAWLANLPRERTPSADESAVPQHGQANFTNPNDEQDHD